MEELYEDLSRLLHVLENSQSAGDRERALIQNFRKQLELSDTLNSQIISIID